MLSTKWGPIEMTEYRLEQTKIWCSAAAVVAAVAFFLPLLPVPLGFLSTISGVTAAIVAIGTIVGAFADDSLGRIRERKGAASLREHIELKDAIFHLRRRIETLESQS